MSSAQSLDGQSHRQTVPTATRDAELFDRFGSTVGWADRARGFSHTLGAIDTTTAQPGPLAETFTHDRRALRLTPFALLTRCLSRSEFSERFLSRDTSVASLRAFHKLSFRC
jgi:hypothetical protein